MDKTSQYIWVYAGEGESRQCIGRLSLTRSKYAALRESGSFVVDLGEEMMAALDQERPIIETGCHALDCIAATQENWTGNKPEWVEPGVRIYPREAKIPVGVRPENQFGRTWEDIFEARRQNEELKLMFGVK